MLKIILTLLITTLTLFAFEIKQTPIDFGEKRIDLTKEYIQQHYGLDVADITIVPKIIVIHYTKMNSYPASFKRLKPETIPTDKRPYVATAGAVNVSAHFMVERDGTIHQLMPLNWMARHIIGLNYSSIGIENIGGERDGQNLTPAQLKANVYLVNYLRNRFSSIEYMIGHSEYRCFEKTPLWLEKDDSYRTEKHDPGSIFLKELRKRIKGLKEAPCD